MSKPLASLSLDLDNQWSYMKIHGESGWESYPSYLDIFVPHVLKVLEELDLKITFFIVGQDASFEKNRSALRQIADAGHEIGNHSFKHETWLHLYSKEQMREEIDSAHEVLQEVTGKTPTGFRGPGFSWSNTLLETLAEKGYRYDASTLPTIIGPLARWYYFRTSNLSKKEREDRKEIFGKFSDGFRRLKPYFWEFEKLKKSKEEGKLKAKEESESEIRFKKEGQLEDEKNGFAKGGKLLGNTAKLLELPVTVMPLFRIPFHLSYLLYLSNFSIFLMQLYLDCAIGLCKLTKTQPSFLLHPLDLIGGDQFTNLAFFPGMNISSERKIFIFKKVIATLSKHYTLVAMDQHVAAAYEDAELPSVCVR